MDIREALSRVLVLAEDELERRQVVDLDSDAVKMIGRILGNKETQIDCSVLFVDEVDDADKSAALNVAHQNPDMEDGELLKEADLIAEMIRCKCFDDAMRRGLYDDCHGIVSKRIVLTFQDDLGEVPKS